MSQEEQEQEQEEEFHPPYDHAAARLVKTLKVELYSRYLFWQSFSSDLRKHGFRKPRSFQLPNTQRYLFNVELFCVSRELHAYHWAPGKRPFTGQERDIESLDGTEYLE